MSAPQKTEGELCGQRIIASCKKIWGADKDFDLDIETDDWEHYVCYVREDLTFSLGPILAMEMGDGPDRPWIELERKLGLCARDAEARRQAAEKPKVLQGRKSETSAEAEAGAGAEMDAKAVAKSRKA